MAWVYLVIAGLFEVVWSYYLKESNGMTKLVPSAIMVVAMTASFGFLAAAMKALPLGTAYTIWTGIGAIGAFAVGIVVLGEEASILRICSAALIVVGLIGLKLGTPG